MTQATLSVPNISCEHCEHTIKETLGALSGVGDVAVSIPEKTVSLQYDDAVVQMDDIKAALAEEEYPVEELH
ncbi:MAG TPA: heavy-metal-associated domain-containing protein [Chloroflexota bacterium]|nr:heavy-metal-associated domain-containing protein [Chloroflexota bacterium]